MLALILALVAADWRVQLDEYSFAYSVALPVAVISGDKTICLADSEHKLYFFDDNGSLIVQTGGKGLAPQEFGEVSALYKVPGTANIAVYDRELDRLSFWSPRGEFLEVVKLNHQHKVQPTNRKNGYLIDYLRFKGEPFEPSISSIGLTQNEEEKVQVWKGAMTKKNTGILAGTTGFHTQDTFPWHDRFHYALTNQVLAVADFNAERVHLISTENHKMIAEISPEFTKVPVPEWMIEEVKNEKIGSYQDDLNRYLIKEALQHYEPPPHFPPIMRLLTSPDGTIWLFGPARPDTPYPYKAYDHKGKELASGEVSAYPLVVGNGSFFLLERNDQDEYTLLKEKINPQ